MAVWLQYTSAPNKTYSFQSSNVEILPLQKKIDPAQVIVTTNGQTISEIDELLDFGGYYRIVRNGKKDLSFRRSEVQFQKNCLKDGKNQEAFQYFKETAAAISLEVEGINILSMQYDKIKQVSEDTVLAIEVDGTGFHEAGSKQAERDMKKNSVLEKCAVPLLRLRTDGSGEKEKIRNALKRD